ncbi:MAG: RNA polymerase factor sigma-32 [Sphingomonadales bacterium]
MAQGSPLYLSRADRLMIRKAMRTPMLAKSHELELARRWREKHDQKALNELTQAYIRLAVSMASKFKSYGLPLADLIQEGVVGLMEAASRFEPDRELRFSTYASWWVRASIQDYILRNWSIVRSGTTTAHKRLFFNLRRLRGKIAGHKSGPLNFKQKQNIAEELGVRVQDVEHMEGRLSGVDGSLNAQIGDSEGQEWQDFLPCKAPTPDKLVLERMDLDKAEHWVKEALDKLSEREAYIIRKRRLEADEEHMVTLAALGDELGISKERVRQIETQALNKLQAELDPVLKQAFQN